MATMNIQVKGIQKQLVGGVPVPNVPTILGSLEIALKCLRPANAESLRVNSSSRTDANVHAFNNPCHVDLQARGEGREYDADFLTYAINHHLVDKGEDIRVVKTLHVNDDFHCRRLVTSRHYVYRLAVLPKHSTNVFSTHIHPLSPAEYHMSHCVFEPMDMTAVQAAAHLLSGTHDFTAFCNSSSIAKENKDPVKTLSIGIERCRGFMTEHETRHYPTPTFWQFHFTSRSFLYKQIRHLMGALIWVGQGRFTLSDIRSMLSHPHETRRRLVVPGHGLSLVSVNYHESVFTDTSPLKGAGKKRDMSSMQYVKLSLMNTLQLYHDQLEKTSSR